MAKNREQNDPNAKNQAGTQQDEEPKAETLDGLPPGAHAPSTIGTGAPSAAPADPTGERDKDVTKPQNHVEDPKVSPKEQAFRSKEQEAHPREKKVPAGKKRVRLLENITVEGKHCFAGDTADVPESDLDSLDGKFEEV